MSILLYEKILICIFDSEPTPNRLTHARVGSEPRVKKNAYIKSIMQ